MSFVRTYAVDLIFLDIHMQTLSGMEFLKLLKTAKVILTTAYAAYALESYSYGVVDYLLKPIAFDRFLMAVEKVDKRPHREIEKKEADTSFLYVRTDGGKLVKINFSEIRYIEGQENNVVLHLAQTDTVTSHLTLKNLEEQLPSGLFIRVHKSYILHWRYFQSLERKTILLTDGNTIPLGAAFRARFMSEVKKHMIA